METLQPFLLYFFLWLAKPTNIFQRPKKDLPSEKKTKKKTIISKTTNLTQFREPFFFIVYPYALLR